jgi:uncharacterized protein YcfJ
MVPLAVSAMTAPGFALGKQYCRDYATRVAGRKANAGDVLAGTAMGVIGGALLGAAIDGGKGARTGALLGGAGGTVAGGIHTSDRWRRIYNRAYADCRAS